MPMALDFAGGTVVLINAAVDRAWWAPSCWQAHRLSGGREAVPPSASLTLTAGGRFAAVVGWFGFQPLAPLVPPTGIAGLAFMAPSSYYRRRRHLLDRG